jgi:hypothetical protein
MLGVLFRICWVLCGFLEENPYDSLLIPHEYPLLTTNNILLLVYLALFNKMIKMRNIGLLLSCLFASVCGYTQESIPFRLTTHNNLIVQARVNQKDSLDLMFQIAMEEGAISPEPKHRPTTIVFDKTGYSSANTVQILNHQWDNIPFIDKQYSGQESDGKIGTQLFKDRIFEINYDASAFVLYDAMPSTEGYQAIPISFRDGIMFIEVESEINKKLHKHWFYLQSGYSGTILYDDAFSEKNQLKEELKTMNEIVLKNSAGQSVITNHAVIDQVSIGGFVLAKPTIGYFTGELKTHPISLFGADMLKRFNWIINADRTMAWIKPSKYYDLPYSM